MNADQQQQQQSEREEDRAMAILTENDDLESGFPMVANLSCKGSSRRESYATVATTLSSSSSSSSQSDDADEFDDSACQLDRKATIVNNDDKRDEDCRYDEIALGVTIFLAAHLFKTLGLHPHQRPMPVTADNEWHPEHAQEYHGETISGNMLFVLAIYLPMSLQVIASYLLNNGKDRLRHVLLAASTWLVGMGLCMVVTDGVKLYAGYLRPIFLTVCQPDHNGECSIPYSEERHLRTSFPSGHSSLSFCGMMLLSQYWRKMAASIRRTSSLMRKVCLLMSYTPMLLAIYIAASRVHDNKHFPADVIAGAILGGSIGKVVHDIWYESDTE